MVEAGEHTDKSQNVFHNWIGIVAQWIHLFTTDLDDNVVKYDSFFENLELKKYLDVNNVEIDLYGQKCDSKKKYILSSKLFGLCYR